MERMIRSSKNMIPLAGPVLNWHPKIAALMELSSDERVLIPVQIVV